jgi:hypothetical protein
MTLRFDLRINQGETFVLDIPVYDENGDPANLTGNTVRGQIRSHAAAPTVLYAWTTTALNLAFGGSGVVLSVPAADSSAWTFRTGAYDIELQDTAGNVTRLVEGHVVVQPEITR